MAAEHRERTLSTQEVYELVDETRVPGFNPRAQQDRNLVNRELSDLAGMSPESHSKPAPQLLALVAGSTSHITYALRWTTYWRWPTTAGRGSGTCSCCAVIATVLRV